MPENGWQTSNPQVARGQIDEESPQGSRAGESREGREGQHGVNSRCARPAFDRGVLLAGSEATRGNVNVERCSSGTGVERATAPSVATPSLPFSDGGGKRGHGRVIAARKSRKPKGSDDER
jgi:hypothetical protein